MKLIVLGSLFLFLACTEKKVSFQTQEDARRQAKENSEFNAQAYRLAHDDVQDYRLVMRGDSTIGPDCAQGDGWATVDLVKGNDKVVLKCSTISETIGCMTKKDCAKRTYAKEDGRCNPNVPHPLPKIAK